MPALHAHVALPWLTLCEGTGGTERTVGIPFRRLSSTRLTCSGVKSKPRCSCGGGVVKRELDATGSMGILGLLGWDQEEQRSGWAQ